MSSFTSLYTVRSGLDAARRALDVVGQNVANANTAGYTRQEVSTVAAQPTDVIRSAGRGISDVQVLRYRDEFLDRQYRARSGMQSYYDTVSTQMSQVEKIMGDLSDTGLRSALDQFFNSWDNLSSHPTDSSARTQVVTAAQDFIDTAKSAFSEMASVRQDLDDSIRDKVNDINSAAQQLADLNQKIMLAGKDPANDLKDQRDRLLDSLAKLAGTTSVVHSNGTVTVNLGSLPIVDQNRALPINATVAMEPNRDTPPLNSAQQNLTTLDWNGTISPAPFQSGEVAALINVRDQSIPTYQKFLDNLVRTVANQVNTAHMAADANGNLPPQTPVFTAADGTSPIGNTWMDIAVNAAIVKDPTLITAAGTMPVPPATTVAPSDGDRALTIARLRDQTFMTGNPVGTRQVSAGDYLRAVSTQLGLEVQQAQGQSTAAGLAVQQAENQRQSVSGVSLDDEMTKMMQYQQTYNAAARMMTTIDEMLDTVVNRVGTVGR